MARFLREDIARSMLFTPRRLSENAITCLHQMLFRSIPANLLGTKSKGVRIL